MRKKYELKNGLRADVEPELYEAFLDVAKKLKKYRYVNDVEDSMQTMLSTLTSRCYGFVSIFLPGDSLYDWLIEHSPDIDPGDGIMTCTTSGIYGEDDMMDCLADSVPQLQEYVSGYCYEKNMKDSVDSKPEEIYVSCRADDESVN